MENGLVYTSEYIPETCFKFTDAPFAGNLISYTIILIDRTWLLQSPFDDANGFVKFTLV
jgi:hypothetical protein